MRLKRKREEPGASPAMFDEACTRLVDDYIAWQRGPADHELASFRELDTDEEAVSRAALGQFADERPHPHQYRVPRVALKASRRRLIANLDEIRRSKSFEDLIELVERISGSIPGIGPLAIYDTSLRIGARFGISPTSVYLHRGTRDGAKALGLDWERATIPMSDLPQPVQKLTAREAEDFLCIFKRELRDLPKP